MAREPKRVCSVFYEDIENGEMPGKWLLSYRDEDLTLRQVVSLGSSIQVATFETKEAALDMAAQLDELMGTDRLWEVDTVFIGENHRAADLAAMVWGDDDDYDETDEND